MIDLENAPVVGGILSLSALVGASETNPNPFNPNNI
jgi:hypothetical protein